MKKIINDWERISYSQKLILWFKVWWYTASRPAKIAILWTPVALANLLTDQSTLIVLDAFVMAWFVLTVYVSDC